MSGIVNGLESRKRIIAILLVVIMFAPYAVKVLHHHPVIAHTLNLPNGLNGDSTEHSAICEICSFEYVIAQVHEPFRIRVYQNAYREAMPITVQLLHSLFAIFASLRAPPACI